MRSLIVTAPKPGTAGPLAALHFVHNAIRRETLELERAVAGLDTGNPFEFTMVARRYAEFEEFLKEHEAGEEDVLYPAIEEKAPDVVGAYAVDHRSNDNFMESLSRGMDALERTTSAAESAAVARTLWVDAVALRATMQLHLYKEEEHLLGVVDRYFSVPEQGALTGKLSAHAGDRMAPTMGWLFTRLEVDDQTGLLAIIQRGAPPQAMAGISAILAGCLPADNWAEICRRLPGLGAPSAPATA